MASATLDNCRNGEYVLHDVLDEIFKNLPAKTLRNIALVSRSWNAAAKRSILKRGRPRRVLLPVLYNEDKPKLKVNDYFDDKPNTVLMFCGPNPYQCPILSLEYKVMGAYHKRLPGRIILVGVDQAMMDTEEVRSCEMQTYASIGNTPTSCNNILGLCLPESENFKIKVVECVSHEKDVKDKAQTIVEELHQDIDKVQNPIFLLFSRSNYTTGNHVMRMFREKYGNKPVNVWGSMISDFIKRNDDGYPKYRGTHGFLGILLDAPRLSAHCLVVPIDLEETMAKRLSEFQHSLNLKRYSVGLVCGPTQYRVQLPYMEEDEDEDEDEDRTKNYRADDLMKLVKMAFPTIDFTGMFNNPDYTYYGCDHTSKTGDYSLEHKGALSIMILTYN